MKKTIALILAIIMISALAVSVCASDDAKLKIYNAAKDACPEGYRDNYLGTVQAALDQIPVTDAQAETVVALINEAKVKLTDKGSTLHDYNDEEVAVATGLVDDICEVLGLTTTVKTHDIVMGHEGDISIEVAYNGAVIATLDGDPIKVTGGVQTTDYTPVLVAVVLAVMGLAGVVTLKKREF